MRRTLILSVMVLCMGFAGCFGSDESEDPIPSPSTIGSEQGKPQIHPESDDPNLVRITDAMAFVPSEVTITAGSTIKWINDDNMAHTVTHTTNPPSFDSGVLAKGETFEHTFNESGTFEVRCTFHSGMRMTITVEGTNTSVSSDNGTDGGASSQSDPVNETNTSDDGGDPPEVSNEGNGSDGGGDPPDTSNGTDGGGENITQPSVDIIVVSVTLAGTPTNKTTWQLKVQISGSDASRWQDYVEVTITVNGSRLFPGQDFNDPMNITISLPVNLDHNQTFSWNIEAIAKEDGSTIVNHSGTATTPTAPDDGPGGQTTYDSTDLSQFWLDFFFCQTAEDRPFVDDLDTSAVDNHQCETSITVDETRVIISSNGLPNHDFESTLACTQAGDCGAAQEYTWNIPRSPQEDTTGGHDSTNCPEANGGYECAADRGSIAVAVNGVPIFGPEDGPGGDAVAAEHGVYTENRQQIELGICHGHAAQGGTYHYHADSNCMHWHPGDAENIKDDYDDSTPQAVAQNTYDGNHSKVIGAAFDGYPIYGFWGYDDNMNIVEMKSSYELKDGETGYNGIDDYKYTEGLGHLDVCNGHVGPTPEFPEGIYHYHSTMQNGAGEMGFPYFLICYHGIADMTSEGGGGQGGGGADCSGFGETWGPGIGPPPPGCENGPPPNAIVTSSSANPSQYLVASSIPSPPLLPRNGEDARFEE